MPAYPKSGSSVYPLPQILAEDPPGSGSVYPVQRGYVKEGGSLYEFFGGGLLYVLEESSDSYVRAYTIDGMPQPSRDIQLIDSMNTWAGLAIQGQKLYALDGGTGFEHDTIRVWNLNGIRLASEDWSLGPSAGGNTYNSITTTTTRLYAKRTHGELTVWGFDGTGYSTEEVAIGAQNVTGVSITADAIYVINSGSSGSRLRKYTRAGIAVENIGLSSGGQGLTIVGDRAYLVRELLSGGSRVEVFGLDGTYYPDESFDASTFSRIARGIDFSGRNIT